MCIVRWCKRTRDKTGMALQMWCNGVLHGVNEHSTSSSKYWNISKRYSITTHLLPAYTKFKQLPEYDMIIETGAISLNWQKGQQWGTCRPLLVTWAQAHHQMLKLLTKINIVHYVWCMIKYTDTSASPLCYNGFITYEWYLLN